ncbi:MAG: sigma-54-dependent Fis family transcriptional regulator [Bacteriovorax sp.]|nr:sigma-54-dependent Fis family transcriptional regulator [Bacteriovorax sp.]
MDYKKFINLSVPLLITGETGTGKSVLAKKIFEQSHIHREKFLTVHLASLKEELIESELFGHKKGAFTGAVEVQNGYLKDTGAGTLFLDEIGELSLDSQKKLLYLLEEKKFTPLGSTAVQEFRGRIILATNRNLEKMVNEGSFREDLFYRITVFNLHLPALAVNKDLLRESIRSIFFELKSKYRKHQCTLSGETLDYLVGLEWKGNFRELRNTLEYAVVMNEKSALGILDFPRKISTKPLLKEDFISTFPEDFSASLELFEEMYLKAMFQKHAGKVNETARRLGMSKTTLIHKARKYQINTLKIRADNSEVAA